MSAQLGKCGVNPALRNSQEIRENGENLKIPCTVRSDRTESWITGLTEYGSVSSRNHCRSDPVQIQSH